MCVFISKKSIKLNLLSILFAALIVQLCSCNSDKASNSNTKLNDSLSLMTYNVRLDIESDGENAWATRKSIFFAQVKSFSPDIMGVQEARPNQMLDLKKELNTYASIGIGRDGADRGEYSAIFYQTKKFSVEKENTFWLSENPDTISKGWDAAYPRICTYGLFTNKESNQKLWIFNTHLDHVGKEAQLQGMQLIVSKMKALNTANYPAVVMGDFNVEPNSELISNLKRSMNDAKDLAKVKTGSYGTFNGFNTNETAKRRIDYIMISKSSDIEVEKYVVPDSIVNSKYPSDHFPVFVELKIR